MWLGRCGCGRDIVVPTAVIEAIVRVRALLSGRRIATRLLERPGQWLYGVLGLMLGVLMGLLIAPVQRPAERPVYVGDFVRAQDFNRLAARLGCPKVEAADGELLSDAVRALHRCVRDRHGRTDPR
jgi:hypothetical protein